MFSVACQGSSVAVRGKTGPGRFQSKKQGFPESTKTTQDIKRAEVLPRNWSQQIAKDWKGKSSLKPVAGISVDETEVCR